MFYGFAFLVSDFLALDFGASLPAGRIVNRVKSFILCSKSRFVALRLFFANLVLAGETLAFQLVMLYKLVRSDIVDGSLI